MQISANGLNLIKHYEGLYLTTYVCPAGDLTIGYGHRHDVQPDEHITEEQADQFLQEDLAVVYRVIEHDIKVPLSQNQFDALCSLIFNIGGAHFNRSTLLAKLNLKDYVGAAKEFKRWDYVDGQIVVGLKDRRDAEYQLFMRNGIHS